MDKNILAIVKIGVMILATIFSLIAILYVVDIVSAEHLKKLLEKSMVIVGVITMNFLVIIILSGQKTKGE